jgi:hypothetical protein
VIDWLADWLIEWLLCPPNHSPLPLKLLITQRVVLSVDIKKLLFLSKNAQKAFRMGPQNHQKIDKIQAWTPQGPSLCPPTSQDRPRIVPGSPRTPK